MRLGVTNGGDTINYDHADWALARLECGEEEPPAPTPQPPANTALPAISGTAQEGKTLSASTGTWTNSPTGYAYAWKRCDSAGANCSAVSGASGAQYSLGAADVGKTLRVTVTATNGAGSSSATSAASAVVSPAPAPPPLPPPVNVDPPTVVGAGKVGKELRASPGTWTNGPTRFVYEWRRCREYKVDCQTIVGATREIYVPTSEDVDFHVVVVVTAWNVSGTASAWSLVKPNERLRIRP
jgi:hypothetical protein